MDFKVNDYCLEQYLNENMETVLVSEFIDKTTLKNMFGELLDVFFKEDFELLGESSNVEQTDSILFITNDQLVKNLEKLKSFLEINETQMILTILNSVRSLGQASLSAETKLQVASYLRVIVKTIRDNFRNEYHKRLKKGLIIIP